ncbi:hypothetical protein [Marinomonas sp.]
MELPKNRSEALNFLASKKVKVHLDKISATERDKVFKKLDRLAAIVGRHLYQSLMARVIEQTKKTAIPPLDRGLLIYPELTSFGVGTLRSQLPFAYLYILSLKHYHPAKVDERLMHKIDQNLDLIFSLSASIMAVEGHQTYNRMEPFVGYYGMHRKLEEIAIKDSIFNPVQYNYSNGKKMVHGLFGKEVINQITEGLQVKLDLSIYIDIFDHLHAWNTYEMSDDVNQSIMQALEGQYDQIEIIKSVEVLTNDINQKSTSPYDSNFYSLLNKPFIKGPSGNAAYPTSFFHIVGFIKFLQSELKRQLEHGRISIRKQNALKGEIAERFIENELRSSNINFHHSATYTINKNTQSHLREFGIKATQGECDFIIESSSCIVFVELKTKELVSESRSGNQSSTLEDITYSFLHSQKQCLVHEYVLLDQSHIMFSDNYQLEHRGRDILRVSLSVMDYGTVSDLTNINRIVYDMAFSADDGHLERASENTDQNELLKKINDYRSICRAHEEKLNINTSKKPFMQRCFTWNSLFLNTDQLLELLYYYADTEKFVQALYRSSRTGNFSQNWLIAFHNTRKLFK